MVSRPRDHRGRFLRERDTAFPSAAIAVGLGFLGLLLFPSFRESILAFLLSLPIWLIIGVLVVLGIYAFGRR